MSGATLLIVAAVYWLVLCGLAGWMAREKGRDPVSFFLVALFFSPPVGIIAAASAAPGKARVVGLSIPEKGGKP
jgi:hypothetical protein